MLPKVTQLTDVKTIDPTILRKKRGALAFFHLEQLLELRMDQALEALGGGTDAETLRAANLLALKKVKHDAGPAMWERYLNSLDVARGHANPKPDRRVRRNVACWKELDAELRIMASPTAHPA